MDSRIILFLCTFKLVTGESVENATSVSPDQPSWIPTSMTADEFYRNHGMNPLMAAEQKRLIKAYKIMVAEFYGKEVNVDDLNDRIDDIIFLPDQIQRMTDEFKTRHQHRTKRKVTDFNIYSDFKWTPPIIYDFDGTHSQAEVNLIEKAMEHWENRACLTFRRRTNSDTEHFIVFTATINEGCYSFIGNRADAVSPQIINLESPGCTSVVGTSIHEIGHTVGLYHEHVRPDRDQYVDINLKYVNASQTTDFEIVTSDDITTLDIPYDFSSTMHYPRRAFSTDAMFDTITPKNPIHYRTVGQTSELTFWDAKIINLSYCPDACAGVTLDCQHEGYPDPKDCSVCRCPPGLGGTLCDQVAASDPVCNTNGQALMATEADAVLQSPGFNRADLPFGTQCNWLVQAPDGCTVNFTIVRSLLSCGSHGSIDAEICQSWLEIRDMNEGHGHRVCCESQEGDVLTSPGTQSILTLRTLNPRRNFGLFEILFKLTDASCLTSPTTGQVPIWGYVLIVLVCLAIITIAICVSMRSANAAPKEAPLATSGQPAHKIYDIPPDYARHHGYYPQHIAQDRILSSHGPRLSNGAVNGYYPTMTPSEYLPRSNHSASVYVSRAYNHL